jgi:LPXTG-site transpeptidase (sortase) family protein
LAVAIIGIIFLFANQNSRSEITNLAQEQNVSTGLPVRIKIPSINVDAAIEDVAVTAEGNMDVPKSQFDTAWYELGPRPGEIGSAVIAGHKDWKNGKDAIFADLHKLIPGDKVVVEDGLGGVSTFVVRASRAYNPASDATDIFRSNDGKAHLNLITCQGIWDKGTQGYSERLVVLADKE